MVQRSSTQSRSGLLCASDTAPESRVPLLEMFYPSPLCSRCCASYALEGDALCAACRAEVDDVYGDLPGARP